MSLPLYLIVLLPLIGFVINGVFGEKLAKPFPGVIACLSVGLAFAVAVSRVLSLPNDTRVIETAYEWMSTPGGNGGAPFSVNVAFMLDHLSAVMIIIITGIGLLIHIYSVGYMKDDHNDPGGKLYARYFAVLNLFIAFMAILVLADNFLLTFVGWEGVGLCSYFLIGYWFTRTDAAEASKKAFIANRVGDWGFLLAMMLIFLATGTLRYYSSSAGTQAATAGVLDLASTLRADNLGPFGTIAGATFAGGATLICLLLVLAATGKSAQIPLYTWLPDAMAGPTPVSALIHAATMVTAGVYIVARCAPLFDLAPGVKLLLCVIGALTALFAALTALAHSDIKKVLAYSTVSQLGFMFMGVGAGAYSAAMFHVFTHAFFKACLFLGAGSVIHALHGEQDMRQMGGLKSKMPATHLTFLVSALALAGAVPFAGFFSKDEILAGTMEAGSAQPVYYVCGLIGLVTAFITAMYAGRQYAQVFGGTPRNQDLFDHAHESPATMTIPLWILGAGAVLAGFLGLPHLPGVPESLHAFSNYLAPQFGGHATGVHGTEAGTGGNLTLGLLAVGALIGWAGWFVGTRLGLNSARAQVGGSAQRLSLNAIYNSVLGLGGLFVATFLRRVDQNILDGAVNGVGGAVSGISSALRLTQTSFVRNYLLAMAIGAALIVAYFVAR